MSNKLIEQFTEIIQELDPFSTEVQTVSFSNKVSQLAYDKHGLNAANETEVNNALVEALDQHFTF